MHIVCTKMYKQFFLLILMWESNFFSRKMILRKNQVSQREKKEIYEIYYLHKYTIILYTIIYTIIFICYYCYILNKTPVKIAWLSGGASDSRKFNVFDIISWYHAILFLITLQSCILYVTSVSKQHTKEPLNSG